MLLELNKKQQTIYWCELRTVNCKQLKSTK